MSQLSHFLAYKFIPLNLALPTTNKMFPIPIEKKSVWALLASNGVSLITKDLTDGLSPSVPPFLLGFSSALNERHLKRSSWKSQIMLLLLLLLPNWPPVSTKNKSFCNVPDAGVTMNDQRQE